MMLPPPHDQDQGLTPQQMTAILMLGLLCYMALWFLDWHAAAILTALALALGMATAGMKED